MSPHIRTKLRRRILIQRYGLKNTHRMRQVLSIPLMRQIDRCYTEECRRLILGVSK